MSTLVSPGDYVVGRLREILAERERTIIALQDELRRREGDFRKLERNQHRHDTLLAFGAVVALSALLIVTMVWGRC